MSLEMVHVFVKDRATNRATLTHINPTRSFVMRGMNGAPAYYTWQNGSWYGLGGNSVPESDVPQEFRDHVAAVPFSDVELLNAPSVTKVCKFCKEAMNASMYDSHVERHVDELLRGSASAAVKTAAKSAPQASA